MKLRTRITLIALSVSSAAILLSGCLVVLLSAQTSIRQAEEAALSQSRYLGAVFKNAVNESAFFAVSDAAQSSLVNYLFRDYADQTVGDADFILMREGEPVYNPTGYQPDVLMSYGEIRRIEGPFDPLEYTTVRAGGEVLFLTRQVFRFGQDPYTGYMIANMTHVYRSVGTLALGAVLIAVATVAACALVLTLLLKKALSPVEKLKQQAAQIAGGVYGERTHIGGSDEIAALAHSFNAMAEAVQKNVASLELKARQQEMLLAAVTHEIKTPMTSVIGYSDTLVRTRLSEQQKLDVAERIHEECSYMERLIQKLLRLISTGHTQAELAEESTAALLESVRAALSGDAAYRGIAISVRADGGRLPMDRDLMADLLLNLADNARKAGSRRISITAEQNRISVEDDGCGIPPEKLAHVTQPFYKADPSASRKKGGLGLGLALCREIAKLHGAMLALDSTPGKGTAVHVIFTG